MIEWFPENGSLSDQDSHPERPKGAEGPLSYRLAKTPPPMPSPNAIAPLPSIARFNRPSDEDGRPERVQRAEGSLCGGNSFRFTLLSKNASANHLESHSCKNKGLKVPCFHTLTKNIRGEGVPHEVPCFQLSTLDSQLCPVSPLTSTLTNFASVSALTSTLTKTKDLKSFNINTYKKGVGGTRSFSFRASNSSHRIGLCVTSRPHATWALFLIEFAGTREETR